MEMETPLNGDSFPGRQFPNESGGTVHIGLWPDADEKAEPPRTMSLSKSMGTIFCQ